MEPDYAYWKRLDSWKLGDAVLLLLALDPRHEDSATILEMAERRRDGHTNRRFFESRFLEAPLQAYVGKAKEYLDFAWASASTRKLYIRGISDFGGDPWVEPERWLSWAQSKGLAIPGPLTELLPIPERGRVTSAENEADSLGTKERTTLLTIIAALAKMAGLDYASHPSKVADAIAKATEEIGARVARRTIETHLNAIPEALERKQRP
jgi:hypothetical protein